MIAPVPVHCFYLTFKLERKAWRIVPFRHNVPCFSFKFYRLRTETTRHLFWCVKALSLLNLTKICFSINRPRANIENFGSRQHQTGTKPLWFSFRTKCANLENIRGAHTGRSFMGENCTFITLPPTLRIPS